MISNEERETIVAQSGERSYGTAWIRREKLWFSNEEREERDIYGWVT